MSGRGRTPAKRQRKDKGVSSSAQPEEISNRFIDAKAQEQYNALAPKEVRGGKVLNSTSGFNDNGLNVITLFDYQGLKNFLAFENPVYPSLVHEFYANLRPFFDETEGRNDPNTLVTRVNSVDLMFTEETLGGWLGIPIRDDQLEIKNWASITRNDPNFNVLHELNNISNHRYHSLADVKVVSLPLQARLIGRIIMYNLYPKSGSKGLLPKFQIYLVLAILNRKRINWAGLIFDQLREVLRRKDSNLQFGIALTQVFIKNGVDLSTSESRALHKKNDYFTESMIISMGYKLHHHNWVPSGEAEEESDEEIPDAETEPSNRELMIEIRNLQASTDMKLDKILRRLRRLEMERVAENPNYEAPLSDDDI